MEVVVEGQVGPGVYADGSEQPMRMGRSGEQVVTELHGKYSEQSLRGNVFWATAPAGVILPAPAATAGNVFTLYNPAGSGKNLVLISWDMLMTVIPGTPLTGLYGLFVNSNAVAAAPTGTALAAQSAVIGGSAAAAARPLTTVALPAAPTLILPFGQKVTGEVAAVVPINGLPAYHIDFDGRIVLAPGTAITPQQTVADTTNATVLNACCWEEVPI